MLTYTRTELSAALTDLAAQVAKYKNWAITEIDPQLRASWEKKHAQAFTRYVEVTEMYQKAANEADAQVVSIAQ